MTLPLGFIRATYNFTGVGVPEGAAIVCCHENTASFNADDAATQLRAIFALEVMPVLASEVSLFSVDTKLGPEDTGQIGTSTGPPVAGGDGTNVMSSQVAYLVRKLTALGGRRYRGRMFLPGVGETTTGPGGVITGSRVTGLQTAMDDWLLALETGDVGLFLEHGPKTEWELVNGQPRRVPVAGVIPAPTVVTALQVQPVVATQRRRVR